MNKFWEVLLEFIELFKFWQVIDPYEKGVRIRLGKSNNVVLENGFHWMLPFKLDTIPTLRHVKSVKELGSQTVTTKDDVRIGIQAVVKYEIKDVAKAILEVDDEVEAIAEMTQGIIRTVSTRTNYIDINTETFETEIRDLARKEGDRWGIKVISVTIKSLGKMPTIRLMQ